jgi:26S proteasome regulatory subunit N2
VDAGGRNVTIALQSQSGHKKMAAIVGVAIFCQFWFWYPLVHFLSLAFTPTAVIGLNKDLEIPKPFTFVSNAPPSQYAYPPVQPLKTEEKKKEIKHATLSVTAKDKAIKAKKANKEKSADAMDVEAGDEKKTDPATPAAGAGAGAGAGAAGADKMDVEKKTPAAGGSVDEKKEEKKADEPSVEELSNPARVTWDQQRVLTASKTQRYQPIKESLGGFVMLRDTKPDEAVELVKGPAPRVAIPGISDDEPDPPAPFELSS